MKRLSLLFVAALLLAFSLPAHAHQAKPGNPGGADNNSIKQLIKTTANNLSSKIQNLEKQVAKQNALIALQTKQLQQLAAAIKGLKTGKAAKESAPANQPAGSTPPAIGPKNAPVTIVEFSDFECYYCNKAHKTVKQIVKAYGNKVRVVYRHLPLSFHRNAHAAAQASMAANAQGKFWQFHDKLFANFRSLSRAKYIQFAKELNLDVARFTKELDSGKYKAYVDSDLSLARTKGVRGTPNFFINGSKLVGAQPYSAFKRAVDAALAAKGAKAPAKKPAAPSGATGTSVGPKNAKVTITEYSDFECPYCSRAAQVMKQLISIYKGKSVRFEFKQFPLSFHKNAHAAAQASLAAAAQGKFWAYHYKLFDNQRSLNRATYIRIAKELNLDVARFTKEFDSKKYKAAVDADMAEGGRVGVNGTPSYYVNGKAAKGYDVAYFRRTIDMLLSGKKPKPVKLEVGGSPTMGPANAKVTIYEFSDFECFFCKRATGTIKQIVKTYGNKVRIVYKHMPLGFHKNAHLAAQASMAAHAQGKFWPYHDKLFANYKSLSKAKFIQLAKEVGLDMARFTKELNSGKYKALVDSNIALAGKLGINGTPSFLINGQKVVGAQPFPAFKKVIDAKLGIKAPTPKPTPAGSAPYAGPKNAKVVITEFSDFECPYCSRAAQVMKQLISIYKGKSVRFEFRQFPLSFHKNAHSAGQASLAAHAQGKFWAYHYKLFDNQRSLNRATYIRIAKELKLDVARFTKELDSGKYKAVVDRDIALAGKIGVNGTPSFMINGKKVIGAQPLSAFSKVINAALGIKAPKQKPVKLTSAGSPTAGPANAKVIIYEFSDFECGFCSRAANTIKQIIKLYGNNVRIVYKNFPLGFHANAHKAAQAALAAHAQGKFWAFHDELFKNTRNLSRATYLKIAKSLKLDVARFTKELDSGKYKAQVDADMAAGKSVGVQGTPTFLINGKKFVGAQPLSAFKREIDAAMKK